MIENFVFDSGRSGKHLLVLGAVHGDEPCGTYACKRLMEEIEQGFLKLKTGKVTFIPICNPDAYDKNVRFVEQNLNRVFKRTPNPESYEAQLANILAPHVDDCDYLLDIHSFTAEGEPFVFQDYDGESFEAFAKSLGVKDVMTGWVELYEGQGDLNEGDTISYAYAQGKTAVLVECGQNGTEVADAVAYKTALSALGFLDILEDVDFGPVEGLNVVRFKELVCKDKEGTFLKDYQHMQAVPKGENVVRYQDGSTFEVTNDSYMLMPKANASLGEEWFYLGEKMI